MKLDVFAISPEWNLREHLETRISQQGGWVNAHNHLDKAYLIKPGDLNHAYLSLQEKWDLIDELKTKWSVDQIYDRMAFAIEQQMAQGVTALATFIDVDPLIKDKAILAAIKVREKYQDQITIKYANQTIKGVIEPKAREWFDRAAQFVDIIGGLPGKDKGREGEHLDILLNAAKTQGKLVHVHVDQLNLPTERETELLISKTKEHGMKGKVVAVHGISIAAQTKEYRQALYQALKEQEIMVIACPTAWIDHRRSEVLVPSHNAITPVDELIPAGVTVAIGPDDIADYYKPFTTGEMWTELHYLIEACHFYELDELVKIATSNGRKVLGIE